MHMGTGSAFMHGENTVLGGILDNRMIGVVAYLAHELTLKDLNLDSTIF